MQFSWLKSFVKGAQAIGEAALAAGLVALIDYLLSSVDTTEELAALGMPALYVGLTLFGVRVAANWWKVRRAALAAGKLRAWQDEAWPPIPAPLPPLPPLPPPLPPPVV